MSALVTKVLGVALSGTALALLFRQPAAGQLFAPRRRAERKPDRGFHHR